MPEKKKKKGGLKSIKSAKARRGSALSAIMGQINTNNKPKKKATPKKKK